MSNITLDSVMGGRVQVEQAPVPEGQGVVSDVASRVRKKTVVSVKKETSSVQQVQTQTSSGFTMIAPVTIASGSGRTTTSWTPVDLSQWVPSSAKFVYLQGTGQDYGNDAGDQSLLVRAGSGKSEYTVVTGRIWNDDADIQLFNQGFFPVSNSSIEYKLVVGFRERWSLILLGYLE